MIEDVDKTPNPTESFCIRLPDYISHNGLAISVNCAITSNCECLSQTYREIRNQRAYFSTQISHVYFLIKISEHLTLKKLKFYVYTLS